MGLNIDQMYPSNFLKTADLLVAGTTDQYQDIAVTIDRVEEGEGQDFKTKQPITVYNLHFVGQEKFLQLNKTNARKLSQLFGNDTDMWRGQPVTMTVEHTPMGPGIRFKQTPPGGAAPVPAGPAPAAPAPAQPVQPAAPVAAPVAPAPAPEQGQLVQSPPAQGQGPYGNATPPAQPQQPVAPPTATQPPAQPEQWSGNVDDIPFG